VNPEAPLVMPHVRRHEPNVRMKTNHGESDWQRRSARYGPSRHAQAWCVLVGALAVHVADEALTDFLGFYNPLVLSIRSRVPWFPMPTFTFRMWLAGLVALVLVLAAIAGAVRRGAPGTSMASWALAAIMFLNGLGHLVGSLYFVRWLPGTTSAPFLLIGSVWLGLQTWARTHVPSSELKHAV
jgi:uncharacterized protein with HXXEE motif